MKIKRFTTLIAVLLSISLAAIAQQQDPSAERLQQHVTYLASDALDGRRTGSAGANEAARYITREFSRLGLRPAASASSVSRYQQSFPYIAGVELGKGNLFAFA